MKLMKWYPLLTLPMFIFMGYVLSESKLADDLYTHVPRLDGQGLRGGLAMGTIGLMVLDLGDERAKRWPGWRLVQQSRCLSC
jgi:TRAP-type mannitol/chloroaromatic compound transport system permease large subunit